MNLAIVPAEVYDVIATGLLTELDAELERRYPGEPINGIDAAAFVADGGYFVMAVDGADIAGCAAFRPFDAATIEIKRMFVRPGFRGRNCGRMMLAALETEARRRGFRYSILETAVRQPEAIALYDRCNYAVIEKFGHYVDSARSVCMGKTL